MSANTQSKHIARHTRLKHKANLAKELALPPHDTHTTDHRADQHEPLTWVWRYRG